MQGETIDPHPPPHPPHPNFHPRDDFRHTTTSLQTTAPQKEVRVVVSFFLKGRRIGKSQQAQIFKSISPAIDTTNMKPTPISHVQDVANAKPAHLSR